MNRALILTLLAILVVVVAVPLEILAQTSDSQVPRRIRKRSPIESKIFRSDWWDYYNRAIRKFDAGDLQGAEADFRAAVRIKGDENGRARTYGVRFQEYFPYAELGAVLFEQGKFYEAVPELMLSMKNLDCEQTRFYLHEARRQVAMKSPIDKRIPIVSLIQPQSGMATRQNRIWIQGVAEDDLFVDNVYVGDRRLVVGRANSQLEFATEVPLAEGMNQIPVTVYDLLGQHQTVQLQVEVDRQGPVFSIQTLDQLAGDRIRVTGTAYDRHLVSAVSVSGSALPTSGQQIEQIQLEIPMAPGGAYPQLRLADGFENETVTTLDPRIRTGSADGLRTEVRFAAASQPGLAGLPGGEGPRIDVLDLSPWDTLYQKEAYIDCKVSDASGVADIRIAGRSIDLPQLPDLKSITFGQAAGPLEEGTNVIQIRARNVNQVESIQDFPIVCRDPSIQSKERLSVTVPAFDLVEEEGSQVDRNMADQLREALLSELNARKRFSLIPTSDELAEALLQRRVAASPVADTRFQASHRTLTAADLILDGIILVRLKTVHAAIRSVNVVTGQIDEYIEVQVTTQTPDAVRVMAHDLAVKLVQKYPVAEGEVIQITPSVWCTLSSADRIRTGMQAVLYRTMLLPPKNGRPRKGPPTFLGPSLISTVMDDYSELEIDTQKLTASPEVGDFLFVR